VFAVQETLALVFGASGQSKRTNGVESRNGTQFAFHGTHDGETQTGYIERRDMIIFNSILYC